MKKIYLVFSYSGSIPAKIIKLYTKKEYSHISISLDKNLENMYSFSRLKPNNFLIGGFVHEKINGDIFKKFPNTNIKIGTIIITEEQYQNIIKLLTEFNNHKEQYKYNMIGCLILPLHLKFRRKNHYYCAEFIKYLFEQSGIDYNIPQIIEPDYFNKYLNEIIYNGTLQDYK